MQSENLWSDQKIRLRGCVSWSGLVRTGRVYEPFWIIVRNDLTAFETTLDQSAQSGLGLHISPKECITSSAVWTLHFQNRKKKKVHYIKYADGWKSNSLRFSHWWLRLTQYTTSRKYWPTYFTFVERDLVCYYVVTYTRTTVRYSFEVFWSAYTSCGKVERATYICWQWIFPMRTG